MTGSRTVAAIGLMATGMLLASCSEPLAQGAPQPEPTATRAAPDDEDLWDLIPAEAELLVWADMAQLRSSVWTRGALAKAAPEERAARAVARGFDDVSDVDRLLYATMPVLSEGASVFAAQGRFDRERLKGALSRGGVPAQATSYRGVDILVRGEEALAFLTKRTVLSGPLAGVRAAIDCSYGVARSVASESWLLGVQAALAEGRGPSRRGAAAVVALRLSPAMRSRLQAEMGEGESLEQAGLRLDLGHDLDLATAGFTRDSQQASDLAARLTWTLREQRDRPLVAVLGMRTILDGVRFVVRGSHLFASLRIPEDQRAEIAERLTLLADTLSRAWAHAPAEGSATAPSPGEGVP